MREGEPRCVCLICRRFHGNSLFSHLHTRCMLHDFCHVKTTMFALLPWTLSWEAFPPTRQKKKQSLKRGEGQTSRCVRMCSAERRRACGEERGLYAPQWLAAMSNARCSLLRILCWDSDCVAPRHRAAARHTGSEFLTRHRDSDNFAATCHGQF